MTPRAHYWGDGCPKPHGQPDAPIEWADPGETLQQVRARFPIPGSGLRVVIRQGTRQAVRGPG